MTDTVENIEMFLEPGDRFAIHPATFVLAEGFDEDESRMKNVLLNFVLDAFDLKQGSLETFRKVGQEQWFKTSNPELVLGTDCSDWWLEFASSVPEAPDEQESAKTVQKIRGGVAKKVKKARTSKKRK